MVEQLTVMSSVFDGGDGSMSGGSEERSNDSGVLLRFDAGVDASEIGGDMVPDAILQRSSMTFLWLTRKFLRSKKMFDVKIYMYLPPVVMFLCQ